MILDVGGVGYLVQCPASTLSRLAVGAHAVADDRDESQRRRHPALRLSPAEEREWFRLLQTVQNVGAQAWRWRCSPRCRRANLQRALALGDKAMIGRAPGVGPKLALRIATELKDKAPAMMLRGDDEDGARRCHGAARSRSRCGGGAGQAGLFRRPGGRSGGARRQRSGRGAPVDVADPRSAARAWDDRWPKPANDRLVDARTQRRRCAGSLAAAQAAGRFRRPAAGAGKSFRSSSRPPRRAARRWIMCCSPARRAWARPPWRRSWRANWASISAPPPGRCWPRRAISPPSSPISSRATCCSSTRSIASIRRWRKSFIPRWRITNSIW